MCPLIKEGVRRESYQTEGETKRESGGWVGWGGARKGEREREKRKRESSTVKVFESALVLDAIFRK